MAKGGMGAMLRSPAVYTATTPGMAAASLVSMDTMRPWAMGERTKATRSMPSMRRLSMNVPRPVSRSGSSTRRTALPRMEPGMGCTLLVLSSSGGRKNRRPQSVVSPAMSVAAPVRRGHGHPWLTLLCVTFGLVMVGLDNTIVAVANPTIGREFNASLAGLQWITNAYLLALAALLITGGKLGDRFGRKRVFLVGMAGFTVASAACGLAVNLPMLAIFRAGQGAFGAMLLVQTLAILRATFPVEQIASVVGIWVGASSVAVATGPLVGGLLVQHIGWRAIFFVNIPVGIAGVVAGAWVIRESKDEESVKAFDIPGVILLTGALCLLVWSLIHAEGSGWRNFATPSLL